MEMGRRGELLRFWEAKLEDLIKERDKSHKYAATWKNRAEAVEKDRNETREEKKRQVGALQTMFAEAAVIAEKAAISQSGGGHHDEH